MIKLLTIVVILFLVAGFAHAQAPGFLVVSGNEYGTDCNLYDYAPTVMYVYVVHANSTGAQAAQFKAPVPLCMNGAVILNESTMWPIKIGLVPDGTLIGYNACTYGTFLILTTAIFGQGLSSDCCEYPILAAPGANTGFVEIQDCGSVWHEATTISGWVNPTPECYCDVPVHETTWGKVKAACTR